MFARVLAVLVLVLLVLAGYTGYQALQVKDGLQTVATEVDSATQDLQTGDVASLRERLGVVQDAAAKAARNSRGPGWWLASRLPAIGDDVQAVSTVSDVSDKLASGVLPEAVGAVSVLQNIRPYDGPDAVRKLKQSGRSLVRAGRQLRRQEARVASIRTDELDPRLAEPIKRLQVALGTVSDFVDGRLRQARAVLDSVPSLP